MKNTLLIPFRFYKEAYTGLPREIWTIGIITVINRMGTMVLPFLSVYLTTVLNFSLKDAGILASAFGFGSLGGSYIGGKLTDRVGPRLVITASLLFGGVLFICLQFAHSFISIFLLIFSASLFGEAYRPAMSAAIGMYSKPNEAGRAMAFNRLAINLGMSAAPSIGGFIAVTIGYHWLFWVDGLTCIAAALYFWMISKTWKRPMHATNNTLTQKTQDTASQSPIKNTRYMLFLISTFLMGFAFIQWFHTVPVFIKTDWAFDERYIGILMGASSLLVTLIEMPITHIVEQRNKIKFAIRIGLALLCVCYLPFVLSPSLALCFVAMFLWTLGEILLLPFNNAIPLSMSHEKNRGNYLAWYFMTWSLTNITAPTIGFTFIDHYGYTAFWWLLTLLIAISLFMNLVLGEKIIK
ncbi:MAG: MFS transporter [Flammeovirgaceae bacterium]